VIREHETRLEAAIAEQRALESELEKPASAIPGPAMA